MQAKTIRGGFFGLLFILATVVVTSPSAEAGVRFKLMGGANQLAVRVSLMGVSLMASKMFPMAGAYFDMPFSPAIGAEFGAGYLIGAGGTVLVLPLLLKFYLGEIFNLAAGGAVTVGGGALFTHVGGGFGLDVGGDSVGFVFDARYFYGILGSMVNADHIQGMIGLRIGSKK